MAKAKYSKGKDGYFRAKVWDGTYDNLGRKKRINVTSKKSSADLEKKVNEIKRKVESKEYVAEVNITVYEYAKLWLKTYKSMREINTIQMYNALIEAHIKKFENLKLQHLTHEHIQLLINDISDKPCTCKHLFFIIKQIVRSAVNTKRLAEGSYNALCDGIELPRYIKPERRILTQEEIEAIKKAEFTDEERCFVNLIYSCGLRRQEALALTVFDISFEKCEITINKALAFDKNNPVLKCTKTVRGNRVIPMPPSLSLFLSSYIKKCNEKLFEGKDGDYKTRSSYLYMWKNIADKINVAAGGTKKVRVVHGLTAHIFRHNYCTNLCYQIPTVSTKKIAQLLGDSEKMVLEVYGHIMEEKEEVQDAISRAFNL